MSVPEPLGYVLANVGAKRAPYLSSTSVLSLEDARYEQREWLRAGLMYTICEIRPALDLPREEPSL